MNYGIVHMPAGDCRNLGGAMNGNPGHQTWTACHLDICRDGEFVFDHAQVKAQVAYGIIDTPYDACAYLGGGATIRTGSPTHRFTRRAACSRPTACASPSVTASCERLLTT